MFTILKLMSVDAEILVNAHSNIVNFTLFWFIPQMPLVLLDEMVQKISALNGIARVLYDLTAKPPGTTEWE